MASEKIPEFTEIRDVVRNQLRTLENNLADIASVHPEWIENLDTRSVSLQSLQNSLRFAELSLVFILEQLGSPEWWIGLHRARGGSPRSAKFEFMAFTQCAKTGLFHLAFSAAENSFRALVNALDATACAGGTAEFKSIYTFLLQAELRMPADDLRLLELLRLLRNTIHNEGVHRPRREVSELVAYRGVPYEFVYGKPVEFANWGFVVDRVADLCHLQHRIILHPKVAAITAVIHDPGVGTFPM